MSDIREIRDRIKSIEDTEKITKAMYMISSGKMRKAKKELDRTRPYFDAVEKEIKRIFRVNDKIKSPYMYPESGEHDLPGAYAYIVITSDKGLAGYYNHAVIAAVEKELGDHDYELYVIGEYGRKYFNAHGVAFNDDFLYSAENPTLSRAREMTEVLIQKFKKGEISKIFVTYTDLQQGASQKVKMVRILPFHRGDFVTDLEERKLEKPLSFVPSAEVVLKNMVRSYVTGFLYSALVDSFCCEQSARMNAMDDANKNADQLMNELHLEYNHARQGKITQEITEISAGAKALRKKKERSAAESEG